MNCPGDELLINAILCQEVSEVSQHVHECDKCQARMEFLGNLHRQSKAILDNLNANHQAGRQRLMTLLENMPVPARPIIFRRVIMDRRTWIGFSSIAIVFIAISISSMLLQPGIVFAQVAEKMREVKSFQCDMFPVRGGMTSTMTKKLEMKFTWAAPGSFRNELTVDGKLMQTMIKPHDKQGIVISYNESTYLQFGKTGQQEAALLNLVSSLANASVKDQKPSGTEMIGDIKASRFDLTFGDSKEEAELWRYRIWVNPDTKKLIRVLLAFAPGRDPADKNVDGFMLTNFQWGINVDKSFDVTPPKGFKSNAVVDMIENPAGDEKRIKAFKESLKAHFNLLKSYPSSDKFSAKKQLAEIEKSTGKPVENSIRDGLLFIEYIQGINVDAKYYGNMVGPSEKDKILLRWKQNDGKYRVIYGDLRDEVLSSEKLKAIEGK